MKIQKNFLLGAPIFKKDRLATERYLLELYENNINKATERVEVVTTRSIAKASAILSATSILAGISYFLEVRTSLFIALINIVLISSILYVKWPKEKQYITDPSAHFKWSCKIAYSHSIAVSISTLLIICCSILILFKLI